MTFAVSLRRPTFVWLFCIILGLQFLVILYVTLVGPCIPPYSDADENLRYMRDHATSPALKAQYISKLEHLSGAPTVSELLNDAGWIDAISLLYFVGAVLLFRLRLPALFFFVAASGLTFFCQFPYLVGHLNLPPGGLAWILAIWLFNACLLGYMRQLAKRGFVR